ncbi:MULTISPECIES: electron transfer flavoprotein-ubiquinone oxidoreductase [Vibrio]|uniref:Electron transfer flavoprotein-ubiquinone oxidoreductase n=1 Tax=Vibrio bivalvicida TaxID=1276888 RepID=A0A177XVQ0_9VIBR|nr:MULTISPECIES: electron transfer flavoprotein-ubiquinone oxidoreductase [Vibrio]KLN66507.1 electron transfer flavoprotein-ubiquinone oxidoreductase [Vibrio sp. VPAP30]OAJ92693.1 electron transfer flavoprotein-ubiquinone oxidoreductase [Vibrio bivalvicida]
MERECMDFDVVIVGAGPAGLSAACRLAQLSQQQDAALSICVVEKGPEVGAHILSGAVFETTALNELFPNWQGLDAPVLTPVSCDDFLYLTAKENYIQIPEFLTPLAMRNGHQNYVISLSKLCRWLAQQAESLGVEIFPGFPAKDICFDESGAVTGIVTVDMGLDKNGKPKNTFQAGIQLNAKQTIFAEGARGNLGKRLINHFKLAQYSQPQHYALGIKEVWKLPDNDDRYRPGLVMHSAGWPLSESDSTGGGFLYHLEDHLVSVGLITDLNYSNPYLSPFDEFQRLKHHPRYSHFLQGAERIAYGARAIAKGGLLSLPKQQFPGGLLIGCDAGTLNSAKIKGCHTAMKSGMLAAQASFNAINDRNTEADYHSLFIDSWLYDELNQHRNFPGAVHKYGSLVGGALSLLEQNIWHRLTGNKSAWNIEDHQADYVTLHELSRCKPIAYPKPDGVLSFDKPSSVYLSSTFHEENQPCHLLLSNQQIPVTHHMTLFDEPSQRYCPAGVYEVVEVGGQRRLQINAANCLHCKTCDIKDPSQNITWVPPEGGGPNYTTM